MQRKLILKDSLRHDKYEWPITRVSYPVTLEKEAEEGDWTLRDAQGKCVPFQVTDVRREGQLVKGLILHFLTGLSKGECKEYFFIYGEGDRGVSEEKKVRSSFELSIDQENGSFSVTYGEKRMVCRTELPICGYRLLNQGCIFDEAEITCRGERGQEYIMVVRRITGMPFWELEEVVRGADDNQNKEMRVTFENFEFSHRYSWARPVEKVDAYLTSDHRIPVTVMPFENWVPWIQSKHIAFLGKDASAGLFIRDNLGWDDGKYPVWGANREFGIYFSYEEDVVTAHFPLRNGRRFVGIAVYGGSEPTYVKKLWNWYAYLSLNKVKDWVLNWEEEQTQYPMFFRKEQGKPIQAWDWNYKKGEMLYGTKMTEVIDELSASVNHGIEPVGEDLLPLERGMEPVTNREFASWTVIFDLTADEMTEAEFGRAKAMFAFMAYAAMDENYMPTVNMLAGHPNFLADTSSIPGFAAALFPSHPEHERFRQYFNRAVALNLKYHIRPDVAAYEALGGRETESLGGYCFAMLRPFIHVCRLFDLCGYEIPLACENGEKWLNWMTNCMSAPVDGLRTKPPQGAHSRKTQIPYILYEMAQLLEKKYPETAQNTYAVCGNAPLENFEHGSVEDDIWRTLFRRKEEKGKLMLKSEKFTGYGCILREAVGTPDEISVHVQQLDQGPNYRWGCFENTGNGGIHYYAAGKRYSFNEPEDTGDKNLGAEEGNCGFSVLKGHTYHNIGFQDLTEPLRDFPAVKQIRLMAGADICDFYKYRRVSLVEKDYVVMYDAVTDMRTKGRFLWTVNELEEFPAIWQLVPGAPGTPYRSGAADLATGYGNGHGLQLCQRSRSVAFDGFGNFLTVVSHRRDLKVRAAEYGALAQLPGRTDYIFEDDARIRFSENGMLFDGYSGVISLYEKNPTADTLKGRNSENGTDTLRPGEGATKGAVKGALLEGKEIGCGDLKIGLEGKGSVYFERMEQAQCWSGSVTADEVCILRVNEQKAVLDRGKYCWRLENKLLLTKQPERVYSGNNGFVRDTRRHEWGFEGTDFNAKGQILHYPEG